MKKIKVLMVIVMLLLCTTMLVGCSTETTQTGASGISKTNEIKELKIGDEWIVEGQWKLTINSVTSTLDRNEFSDKNPGQVVVVTYTYENLGYEDEWGIMDGLYFDLEPNGDTTVIDGDGEIAYSYPGDISTYPQETPVGAKCVNAECCIGLNNESETITMNISKYDGNGNEQKVKYILTVD